MPVVMQDRRSVQTVQNPVEDPQVQFLDKVVVDMPVVSLFGNSDRYAQCKTVQLSAWTKVLTCPLLCSSFWNPWPLSALSKFMFKSKEELEAMKRRMALRKEREMDLWIAEEETELAMAGEGAVRARPLHPASAEKKKKRRGKKDEEEEEDVDLSKILGCVVENCSCA